MKIVRIIYLIINFGVLSSSFLISQEFGTENAKWTYSIIHSGGSSEETIITANAIGTEQFKNLNCNVIQISMQTCNTPMILKNYVLKWQGKIWWYNFQIEDFTVLYDFTLNKGESWNTRITENCTITNTIDSVTQTIIESDTLKTIHYGNNTAIETIGNINRFIFPPEYVSECGGFCDGYYINQVRCFQDNNRQFKLIDEQLECDQLTNTQNHNNLNPLSIQFSNPVSNKLTIKLNMNWDQLLIYDTNGNSIEETPNPNKITYITTENWPNGVYILQLIDSQKQIIKSEKIVKSN